jgi:hypothetical protein
MPSLGDYAGALTGSSGRDAAKDAAAAQVAAAEQGMQAIEAGKAESLGYLDPYAQAGKGGLGQYVDYLGGRQVEETPYGQQLMARQMETARREMQGVGMGGGARLKRLMQESAFTTNSLRQQEMDNAWRLGGMGANMAGNQANVATGAAGNMSNLYSTQGDARASGIIGANNAIGEGAGNMLKLGGMAAGGLAGGLGSGTFTNVMKGAGIGDHG